VSNIRNALNSTDISNKIKKEWGRIFVYTNQINDSVRVLQRIFGVHSVSPCLETSADMESISKYAVEISKDLNQKNSFAIRVNRVGNHDFSSQDVAIKIGDVIRKATNATVDLTKPDFEFFIEVRNEKVFLFTEKIDCVAGMPFATQGSVLAIIDSLESVLAAWYLLRRGCKTIFLTEESHKETLQSFTEKWFVKPEIISFKSKNEYYEQIMKTSNEKNCNAIVIGKKLDSTALSDIKELKEQVKLPVLTPLVAMGKDEINKKCKEIELSS